MDGVGIQTGIESPGEPQAGGSLPAVEEVRSQLWQKFRQAGLNTVEADDLTQECLVDLIQRFDRFDGSKGSLDSWIGGFARNAVRSWYRRDAARKLAETSLDQLGEHVHPANPVQDVGTLRHGLSELGVIDRELLYMRFSLGYSFDEIAANTDLTPTNCRKRVSRAVEKLRRDSNIRETLGL